MSSFLLGSRKNGINSVDEKGGSSHIFDVSQTLFLLKRALKVAKRVAAQDGQILFLGKSPKKQDVQRLGRGLSSLLGDSPIQAAIKGSSQTANAIRHDADNAGRDIRALPIEWIVPGPWQPRRNFDSDELKELAVSIKSRGLLQPVIVRPHPDRNSQFQLIAGERRWRASQMAALHEIPAIISNFEDKVGVAVGVSKDLTSKYDAVNLVKIASEVLGGKGGGGRKDFDQAGGINKNKIDEAFNKITKKIN